MTSWFENLPIRRKLTAIVLSICGSVLLLALAAVFLYELHSYRRTLVRDATVLADVVGANIRAAVAFDDENAGREILQALRWEPAVVSAGLYTEAGRWFVDYTRERAAAALPAAAAPDGARFTREGLIVTRPVELNERRIGSIYMVVDTSGIRTRLLLFGGIAALILLGSFWVALGLTAWLQRPITQPILDLAATAKQIAERQDYSVRSPRNGGGEVGTLTAAFNHMLTGIEQREGALRGANESLRAEIIERKLAEDRVHAQVARLAQINQITRAIGERQDVPSVLHTVVRNLEEHMPVEFACVCLYDPAEHSLAVASVGLRSAALAEQLGLQEKTDVPVDANGLNRCVHGELVYEPCAGDVAAPFPQRLAAAGLSALVLAPLVVESSVFGVLVAARRQPSSFSSADCEFLRQLSEHVALAAHQAQLYTALQRAYDDLRQTQQTVMQQERLRALGQMASGIAHDINNAVSPVSLYIESLLEHEPSLGAQAREWLQIVQRAVEDVTHTVSRLREFYRQREPQLILAPVNLNAVVDQVADLTRARWFDMPQQRGAVIDLRRELEPDLPLATGVESEIREALINLVFNAVDAMPQGGVLTLRTRAVAAGEAGAPSDAPVQVAIEVADTGIGMDEETQRRCCEPFFTTKGDRGTGLGLAMVYGIVERNNAALEIDSAIGRGTTMRLLFQVTTTDAETIDQPRPGSRPSQRLRLLIIDDDPVLLKSLSDILKGDGHAVETANGGQAGINQFHDALRRGQPFDAVITDLGMPYVDGRRVAGAIKTGMAETPVILLTGWGNRLASEEAIPPHVDRVLTKPPKLRELREALATIQVPIS
jgi:signal transduction histidine kinase/ActR/RegA family two-component response regulator